MNFLLFHRETLVLPYEAREVRKKLWYAVMPLKEIEEVPDVPESHFKFNGWISGSVFRISKKQSHPDNFLPILSGKIEATSVGSIIFITYRLFFSTIFFLIFWSVVCLLIMLLFIFSYQIYEYAAIAFLLGAGNYTIALVNFNMQIKRSQTLFRGIFSEEKR